MATLPEIQDNWDRGHFWNPAFPDCLNVTLADLPRLTLDDPVVIQSFQSRADFQPGEYAVAGVRTLGRLPVNDGVLGSAMRALVEMPRCPIPDFAPPAGTRFAYADPQLQQVVSRMQAQQATGSGNWAGCHGVGDFHSAIVQVNPSGISGHVSRNLTAILTNTQRAYAEIGLLFRFIGMDRVDLLTGETLSGNIDISMSFVNRSDGWIGLAIVGQGIGCGSNIWAQFLATYTGGSSDAQIIQQWTTLLKHELGHNTGSGHRPGGVMNPTLLNGLASMWTPDDPTTAWLKGRYGGVPVPIGPKDDPTPGPKPDDVQAQLDAIRTTATVNRALIEMILKRGK